MEAQEANFDLRRLLANVFLDESDIEVVVRLLDRIEVFEHLESGIRQLGRGISPKEVPQKAAKLIASTFQKGIRRVAPEDISNLEVDFLVTSFRGVLEYIIINFHQESPEIVRGIIRELERVAQLHGSPHFDIISKRLGIDGLSAFEASIRTKLAGEPVKAAHNSRTNNSYKTRDPARMIWNDSLENLRALAKFLQEECGIIKSQKAFVQFLDPDRDPGIGLIECKNSAQSLLALLFGLLLKEEFLKVINSKGHWQCIGDRFRGTRDKPWNHKWANVLSSARSNKRLFSLFEKKFSKIFILLSIDNETISKYFDDNCRRNRNNGIELRKDD